MNASLRTTMIALALFAVTVPSTVWAAARLHCDVTYAGTTHAIDTHPVTDPYPVPSIDIGGRFWFKAVMVGQDTRVDYVKLYAYIDTRKQPLLIQEAIYLPPFPTTSSPYSLTGQQHLYAGPVERELQYICTLQGVQP
jgi:hypothetical protein